MQKILGLVLVIAGGALLFQGFSRRNSLVGDVAEVSARVANKVDGGTRIPSHAYYIGGGALLVLAGAGVALRKST